MICWATLFCSLFRVSCSAAFSFFCSAFDSLGFPCANLIHWWIDLLFQRLFGAYHRPIRLGSAPTACANGRVSELTSTAAAPTGHEHSVEQTYRDVGHIAIMSIHTTRVQN